MTPPAYGNATAAVTGTYSTERAIGPHFPYPIVGKEPITPSYAEGEISEKGRTGIFARSGGRPGTLSGYFYGRVPVPSVKTEVFPTPDTPNEVSS
jgi:hypothetical protein